MAAQAQSADALVDSVGINVHFSYYGSVYTSQPAQMIQAISKLGIRHLRDQMAWQGMTPSSQFYALHNQLGLVGTKTDYILTDINYPASEIVAYPTLVNDMEAVEASNEYDGSGDPNWALNIKTQQSQLYSTVRNTSALKNITVISPSLAQPQNASQLGNLSTSADVGDSHAYFGGWNPGNPGINGQNDVAYFVRQAQINTPSEATWATETGYWSAQAPYYGGNGVGEALMATYLPRTIFAFWMGGVKRSYIYELADYANTIYFGLMRYDGTPKPAFYAVSNLLTLLSDPGTSFTPGSLSYKITGSSTQLQSLLLAKRDGSYYLALWIEAPG